MATGVSAATTPVGRNPGRKELGYKIFRVWNTEIFKMGRGELAFIKACGP
ncbi:hypothetical protein [Niastella vici]|nr:hypothetical protein [Niastella vici]